MNSPFITKILAIFCVAALASGCANTIRGMGHDGANVVNATQHAGKSIGRAANN